MVLLDTDVITIHQRKNASEHSTLVDHMNYSGETVFVSSVSFEEQMRGWLAYAAKSKSVDQYVHAI